MSVLLATMPEGVRVVSMVIHQESGTVFVATSEGVYRIEGDELKPIRFVSEPETE